ncbi:hypothetical protein RRG08_053486 [Elysia crispata]|uniref:Uncharacterized protein n=1 Tax=Elysia crispata TaxID=231223 RepID=A0AAE1A0H7_9GAST|nr:hypothetical protein RRG08_053486 [Elysia crispata]
MAQKLFRRKRKYRHQPGFPGCQEINIKWKSYISVIPYKRPMFARGVSGQELMVCLIKSADHGENLWPLSYQGLSPLDSRGTRA